ncbi:MAG: DNA repair protein RecO C-terminal domain-containing protein, partial [Candidatus Xenobia bacterium]
AANAIASRDAGGVCGGDVPFRFSACMGGLLCPACGRHDADAMPVAAGTVALYRQLQQCQVTLVPRLSADTVVGYQLESLLRRHLAYRMPHRLKSLNFLEQVRRMERRR